MSIVRLVVEERPLLFFCVSRAVSLLVGVLFGGWMLQLYAIEKRIVTINVDTSCFKVSKVSETKEFSRNSNKSIV